MNRWLPLVFVVVQAACSEGTAPEDPEPLDHVHLQEVAGVSKAAVEAACLATPLPSPAIDWHYVIDVVPRTKTYTYANPWPGRASGDVHAAESETEGPPRFSCTPTDRSGSTRPANPTFQVEVGQPAAPRLVDVDAQVCMTTSGGTSVPAAANRGNFACPHAFGAIFPAVTDFSLSGSFPITNAVEGPACTIFRPTTLGANGRRHPIILWANGITLYPNVYLGMLQHLATQGFVVAATDTARVGVAGNGADLLGCLAYLESKAVEAGSVYENKLNVYRVGVTGHSAGGGGVIMAGKDPRITATAPIQPFVGPAQGYVSGAAGLQVGPMFLSSGSADTEIPAGQHQAIWNGTTVPIFWGTVQGATHNEPLGSSGRYRGPVTAWFRHYLMLDATATATFQGANCALCTNATWVIQRKNGNLAG